MIHNGFYKDDTGLDGRPEGEHLPNLCNLIHRENQTKFEKGRYVSRNIHRIKTIRNQI